MGHTLSFVVGQRGPSTFCAFLRKGSKYYFDIFCVTFDEHELFSDFEKRVASRFVFHHSKRSQSFFLLGNFFLGGGGGARHFFYYMTGGATIFSQEIYGSILFHNTFAKFPSCLKAVYRMERGRSRLSDLIR